MRLENSFILVPGVGEKTEKRLWKNGVRHWDDFKGEVVGRSRKEKMESFLGKARRNLEVGNTLFFDEKLPSKSLWRLYRNFQDDMCFFDIETTGLDRRKDSVTTASFHRNGTDRALVKGQDLTAENLREEISKSSVMVSFNGKRFDQPFLEKNFDIEFDVPHVDLMYLARRLGIGGGLKEIEEEMGIDRRLEDVDGREAVKLWKNYRGNGDQESLEKLVEYNKYDARNLESLFEQLHARLTSSVFEPYAQK